jgi:hypothetical protein
VAAFFVTLGDVACGVLDGAGQSGARADHGVGRQVVEQCVGGIEEQRQIELDAGRRDAVAHAAVDHALGRVAFEPRSITPAERPDRIRIEGHFATGQQTYLLERCARALRLRIEFANRIDLVVEQIHA